MSITGLRSTLMIVGIDQVEALSDEELPGWAADYLADQAILADMCAHRLGVSDVHTATMLAKEFMRLHFSERLLTGEIQLRAELADVRAADDPRALLGDDT